MHPPVVHYFIELIERLDLDLGVHHVAPPPDGIDRRRDGAGRLDVVVLDHVAVEHAQAVVFPAPRAHPVFLEIHEPRRALAGVEKTLEGFGEPARPGEAARRVRGDLGNIGKKVQRRALALEQYLRVAADHRQQFARRNFIAVGLLPANFHRLRRVERDEAGALLEHHADERGPGENPRRLGPDLGLAHGIARRLDLKRGAPDVLKQPLPHFRPDIQL